MNWSEPAWDAHQRVRPSSIERSPAPRVPPATGAARAGRIERLLGEGAADDPACWAFAISRGWVTQSDGTTYQHSPWPRPKVEPDADPT